LAGRAERAERAVAAAGRRAYVDGATRMNVLASCESEAWTLLLGVLHVPQLYSLCGVEGREPWVNTVADATRI
jgi:hypothetical protein